MNSTEQAQVFSSMINTMSRSIEFNDNGLKLMTNTPKCCKKVIINETMLQNETLNCGANCFRKECNGKSMMHENDSCDAQETIKKKLATKEINNTVNTNNEMNLELRSVLRKSGDGNLGNEGNNKNSKILIDKNKSIQILVDKSRVDNYMLNDKACNELTDKLRVSSNESEMINVQHVTLQEDSSNNNLSLTLLEDTRNCDHNKNVAEKSKKIVGSKIFNVSKNHLIVKDPKVIVRTFNINTKRHIHDSAQKTSGIIFPSNSVVNSNLNVNHVFNLESQNKTLFNQPHPIKLNWNSTNNEYFVIKDLPCAKLQPKDPNTCPYCSRCLPKCDAQTQTDLPSPNNKNGIIIGRVDLNSSKWYSIIKISIKL